ncbi:MAG: calcium-binding protein, partial [Hyphomicrobiaceae bacterium]
LSSGQLLGVAPTILNGDPTGDGASGGELNPFLDIGSNSLVIRANPDGSPGNYLHYTGGDHVVLGGTDQADTLIGGIGDDTIWGDGGDDDIEGGDGADILLGGDGDDILTDIGGPNNIQGQAGNDAIFAGGGESLILGGGGSDFVLQGPDLAETFGGLGNDFINAGTESNIIFGNEGDDWLEGGGGNNLLQGDNGDPFLNSTAGGHDVFISGLGDDDYDSEGGDDIMEGADGIQRFEGLNGFDWATYMHVDQGVNVDMLLRAFNEAPLPPSNVSIMDRFDSVEGLSGGRGNDILRGDDEDRLFIESVNNGNNSVLTGDDRFEQIRGLREGDNGGLFDANAIFDLNVTEWGEGDIILGGAGSDLIEGRGGDDIIDGDLKLQVRLLATDGGGNQATAFRMEGQLYEVDANGSVVLDGAGQPIPTTLGGFSNLDDTVFNRVVNPGNIEILREIVDESADADFDTAEFAGNRANYTIETDGTGAIGDGDGDGFITVADGVGTDGVDNLRGIERLVFSDLVIDIAAGNSQATGAPEILDNASGQPVTALAVGQELRADIGTIDDADGIPPGAIFSFTWQVEQTLNAGDFTDIEITNASGEVGPLTGEVVNVPIEADGLRMRVVARFNDGQGVLETVSSAPTVIVAPQVGVTPTAGDDVIIGTNGPDNINALAGDDFVFGLNGDDIINGGLGNDTLDGGGGVNTAVFDGPQANFGIALDPFGNGSVTDLTTGDLDTITNFATLQFDDGSVPTTTPITPPDIIGTAGPDNLDGTELGELIRGLGGADRIRGMGGDDEIRGNGGADDLIGGEGNDRIFGGGGNDLLEGLEGDDFINGGNNGGLGDLVFFSGDLADYSFAADPNNANRLLVTDNVGTDGTDTLVNVEELSFADADLTFAEAQALIPVGIVHFTDATPDDGINVGDTLSADVTYDTSQYTIGVQWQTSPDGASGWADIAGSVGMTYAPDAAQAGQHLRVAVTYYPIAGSYDPTTYDVVYSDATATPVSEVVSTSDSGPGTTDPGAVAPDAGDAAAPMVMNGDALDNTLLGGTGDDTAAGGGGSDILVGGDGNDILIGNDGADTILAGDGNDIVLGGAGADQVFGNAGSDWIDAGADGDVVDAGAGDDTVVATLNDGNDVLRGGDGIDTYDLSGITSDATIDLSMGRSESSQSGLDSISGFENVTAGAGNDTIIANLEGNVLTGGLGSDSFVFNSAAAADGDHITDFEPGDTIDLSGLAASLGLAGGAFDVLDAGSSFSAAGQLIVRSQDGDLLVEGSVDDDADADFAIRVSGKSDLDSSDFGSL